MFTHVLVFVSHTDIDTYCAKRLWMQPHKLWDTLIYKAFTYIMWAFVYMCIYIHIDACIITHRGIHAYRLWHVQCTCTGNLWLLWKPCSVLICWGTVSHLVWGLPASVASLLVKDRQVVHMWPTYLRLWLHHWKFGQRFRFQLSMLLWLNWKEATVMDGEMDEACYNNYIRLFNLNM